MAKSEFTKFCGGNVSDSDRFDAYWIPVTESGCHIWLGEYSHNGYGRFRSGGRRIQAHRFAWIRMHGSIPEGIMVCHKCDTPQCCNPAHLFLGTCLDNKRDSMRKNRHVRGEQANKNRGSILSRDQVMQIFHAPGTHQAVADAFGIARQTVSKIKGKVSWRWAHE